MNRPIPLRYWVCCGLVVLAVWALLGSHPVARLLVSSPARTAGYFITESEFLIEAFGQTAAEAAAGLVLALGLSFVALFACFRVPRLLDSLVAVAALAQVIPLITLAPLFIIVIGIGLPSKVAMAALICVFPIFIALATGVRQVPTEIRTVLYLCDATPWQRLRWAYLPQSLPHLFAGLKIASTLAVIGAIVAEFNGADVGLGKNLYLAAKKLEPEKMMASLVLSSLLGGLLYALVSAAERHWGRWYLNREHL